MIIWHDRSDRDSLVEDNGSNTVDLVLVELAFPVKNVFPFDLYDRSDEQGQEVLLLGRGEFGNGKSLRAALRRLDHGND